MKLILPKVYPITDCDLSGLSHLDQAKRMVDGGATFIQLRDKEASSGAFYHSAVEVMTYAREHRAKIIINDRVDIAIAVGADGVHLGQDDLPPEHARRILGGDAIVGFSTHSLDQARAAVKLPIDYIAIGPVFSTSTKDNPDPVVGLAGLREVRDAIGDFPLVAIGGIDRSKAASVLEAGADSVAVISDIIADPDEISDRVRMFIKAALEANNVGNR